MTSGGWGVGEWGGGGGEGCCWLEILDKSCLALRRERAAKRTPAAVIAFPSLKNNGSKFVPPHGRAIKNGLACDNSTTTDNK